MAIITYIHRLGHFFFSGNSKYIQEVEKNKDKYYNEVKAIGELPKYCGTKIDIVV